MYLEFSTSRLTAICYGWLNIETVFGFVSTSKLMELRMKANELFDLINIEMVFGFVFLHSFQSFFFSFVRCLYSFLPSLVFIAIGGKTWI